MLLTITILAACGLSNPSTPVEVAPVVVAPPAPWQDAYQPGSLIEITPANVQDIWEKTRWNWSVGEWWAVPEVPNERPADFTTAMQGLLVLNKCLCGGGEIIGPAKDPPEPEADERGVVLYDPEWLDVRAGGCLEFSQHDGKWWRGLTKVRMALTTDNEVNREFYETPTCYTSAE
ncbi:TPA: hypothetical protein DEP96_00895 [Candidatus Uhrbacteria bacterium]|nr:hypothetical protein [Candidatus Uhrbacteria bacterium]